MSKIIRKKTLAQRTADKIRNKLEESKVSLGDVLCSERELALQYKVSRKTIRSALSHLVQDGYVTSHERKGYEVNRPLKNIDNSNMIAYVLGTGSSHWEMDSYSLITWNAIQKTALAAGKVVFAISKESMTDDELCGKLIEHKVNGVIVNANDAETPLAISNTGIPLVLLDTSTPSLESVNQDNFGGSFQLTNALIQKGCKKIACLGRYVNLVQGHERIGGYLSALQIAGLKLKSSAVIFEETNKGLIQKLRKLFAGKNIPDGLLVMWPFQVEAVGEFLKKNKIKIPVGLWWGGHPEIKSIWKKKFSKLDEPVGVHWDVEQLAQLAVLKLDERIRFPQNPPSRTMVPLSITNIETSKFD